MDLQIPIVAIKYVGVAYVIVSIALIIITNHNAKKLEREIQGEENDIHFTNDMIFLLIANGLDYKMFYCKARLIK